MRLCMLHQSGIVLQATENFELFWCSPGTNANIIVAVRFVHRRDHVYDLSVEPRQLIDSSQINQVSPDEAERLFQLVACAIDLYTRKYRQRVIRCEAAGGLQDLAFQVLFRQEKLLSSLFLMEFEKDNLSQAD